MTFSIATATREDVNFAVEQAASEGWNPGLHDAAAFHAADPDGFLIGRRDGVPIGCISAVRYPERFGFIGLYIVAPAHRGQGYGMRLWEAGMARLAGCNIGLDGVLAQQDNYRKSGFNLACRNIRFELPRASDAADAVAGADRRIAVQRLADIPFERVAAFDRTAFPSSRRAFLEAWLRMPEAHAFAAVDARDPGVLRGYGVVRRCRHGWKVGPLFAEAAPVATRLFAMLCAAVPATDAVCLDVPEINDDAMALVERHGMREVFRTARMYAGERPSMREARVFGVTTFELG